MSLVFSLAFIGFLLLELVTLPMYKNKPDPLTGIYITKFLAFPTWAALTVSGALGILPALSILALSVIGMVLFMFVSVSILVRKDPVAMSSGDFFKKEEYKQDRANYTNGYNLVYGLLLLAGSVASVMM